VDRFIDAVGERNLRGREAEMRGDDGLDRLARLPAEMQPSTSRTLGEQATVFSLKSRRSVSRLPSGG
jgi:hypothetical protein